MRYAAPFSRSAALYRLWHASKPYAAEAAHVDRLIRSRLPAARRVLELGCGPGLHARELARLGYRVLGVDESAAMLAAAEPVSGVQLRRGDARSLRLRGRFDAVIALFHVFSYLRSQGELEAALRAAARHLRPGGVLVFDCWHGPAVLADPPRPRDSEARDGSVLVRRRSRTRLRRRERLAEIRHEYTVREAPGGRASRFMERHSLRYWWPGEISRALRGAGFTGVEAREWMTERPLSARTWSARYAAMLPE